MAKETLEERNAALQDALVDAKRTSEYWRGKADQWRENFYSALRGEMPHDITVERAKQETE
jgi:hypothetical protein